MKRNFLCMALVAPLVFAVYAAIQLFVPLTMPGGEIEIEIPEGASFSQAVQLLYGARIVHDKNLLPVLARVTGSDKRIRAGYYRFLGLQSSFSIFQQMRGGHIVEYEVTVIEGDSLTEIGEKLAARGLVTPERFSTLTTDREFLNSLNIAAPSIEGYLFPQTYKIPKGKAPESILKLMVGTLRVQFNGELRGKAVQMGWSENEVLTLASIIEREAQTDGERPLISGVYHNRIRAGMPLQADPTAVYGVKSYRERITPRDIRKHTEYNTYVIRGLPPGPIASPGIKSITAALYPADVGYLYFVSKGDGTHYFSMTLSEHAAAIQRVKGTRVVQERSAEKETPGERPPKTAEKGG